MGMFFMSIDGLRYYMWYIYILKPYDFISWLLRTSCRCIALSQVLNDGLHQTSGRGRIFILYF
jgi:hypothetical protein